MNTISGHTRRLIEARMPEISRFYGIVIVLFYDDHEPPHFHARYGRAEAAVEILTLRVMHGSLPTRATRLVKTWGDLRREELLAA
jgi:Domain of unknown function (DUF4160)